MGNVSDTHPTSATGMARANWQCQKQKNQFVTGDNLFVAAATKKNEFMGNTVIKGKAAFSLLSTFCSVAQIHLLLIKIKIN